MNKQQKCPKCGELMKYIPIKRLDSILMIELYCDRCEESITMYPDSGKIKFEQAKFF
ncbi:MAG: hypothetical protein QHH19_03175 [Candidatus Thermoplasmatota archaeon]|jgi:transcription initiation factor IIE alpha subunit|nr:hypothetical protein [Candidatus Thermoplasmatota archaeon]